MNNVPVQMGVTGGLGAGKSLICEIFSNLGIPVYNADDRARWLMENNEELVSEIKGEFGEGAYSNEKLDRDFMAARVFNDKEQLNSLNQLVHPIVRLDAEEWAIKYPDKPYLIREAALMIESGAHKDLDLLLVVTAPVKTRKDRVLKRDPFRRAEEIDKIIENQLPEVEKVKLANHIIINDGSQLLIPQVLSIHNMLTDDDLRTTTYEGPAD
jgi:dephospho-CoA kinase